jgi:hypothetical protein
MQHAKQPAAPKAFGFGGNTRLPVAGAFFLLLSLLSCRSIPTAPPENAVTPWHLVTVTKEALVAVRVYPGPDDLDRTGVFPGKRVAPFAATAGVDLAFNASPFDTPGGYLSRKRRTVGLLVTGGRLLSPPVARYAALVFREDGRFAVLQSQEDAMPTAAPGTVPDAAPVGILHAIGGFFPILRDGEVVAPLSGGRDARLAAGVSSDGGTLYLLIGAGSDWGGGRGLTHRDCAELLRRAGAVDALALDGGSSVCVVIGGKALPNGFEPRSVGVIVGVRVSLASSMGGLRAPPSPPAPGTAWTINFLSLPPR